MKRFQVGRQNSPRLYRCYRREGKPTHCHQPNPFLGNGFILRNKRWKNSITHTDKLKGKKETEKGNHGIEDNSLQSYETDE